MEQYVGGRLADHELEIARHNLPAQVSVEQLQILRGKLEGHGFRFAGVQRYLLEAAELLDGS
jgi:hypothetical protein